MWIWTWEGKLKYLQGCPVCGQFERHCSASTPTRPSRWGLTSFGQSWMRGYEGCVSPHLCHIITSHPASDATSLVGGPPANRGAARLQAVPCWGEGWRHEDGALLGPAAELRAWVAFGKLAVASLAQRSALGQNPPGVFPLKKSPTCFWNQTIKYSVANQSSGSGPTLGHPWGHSVQSHLIVLKKRFGKCLICIFWKWLHQLIAFNSWYKY